MQRSEDGMLSVPSRSAILRQPADGASHVRTPHGIRRSSAAPELNICNGETHAIHRPRLQKIGRSLQRVLRE